MVLAHTFQKWIDKKFRQGDEKRVAEALAKNNQAWNEWLTRYEEAEARGEGFNEPPPNGKV